MNRTARWVAAVVMVQAALVGLYWLVEHRRAPRATHALSTARAQRVDMMMPPLVVRHRDGRHARVESATKPMLVHIWATWCPPCRAELPGLLAVPRDHSVDVVAISLDTRWADVERFLGGVADTSHVVLADSADVERALRVTNLPVTFLLQPDGRLVLRIDGARDWTDDTFVQSVLGDRFGAR